MYINSTLSQTKGIKKITEIDRDKKNHLIKAAKVYLVYLSLNFL